MDEYIDVLLHDDRSFDIQLPRLQVLDKFLLFEECWKIQYIDLKTRTVLEENGQLDPRVSALDDDIENAESSDDETNVHPTAVSHQLLSGTSST